MQTSKNIIFYGPPGTGKTYRTVRKAVEILDGTADEKYEKVLKRYEELKELGLIEFTTFHQSYGYEDFIEGIRPVIDDKGEATELKYEMHNGVFKKFCNKNIANDVVWAVRPGNPNESETDCIDNGYIQYGDDENKEKIFKDEMQIGDIVLLYTGKYNYNDSQETKIRKTAINAVGIITGEYENVKEINNTYPNRRNVVWLKKVIDPEGFNDIKSVILDPDKGLNVTSTKITAEYIFNVFNISKVFIIDEINRGNISKIFGELITLIEDTKRLGASEEQRVKLPYSNEDFGVPDNVYIIGTMNTADRSIAALDTALHRRFDFEEMMPDSSLLEGVFVEKINIQKLLDTINKRIEVLCDREHQIGHAYFMSLKAEPEISKLESIFRYKIIPLLQEYFYEDYEKIQLVLRDNKKRYKFRFIKREETDCNELFGENDILDSDALTKYSINYEAFSEPEAYREIYSQAGDTESEKENNKYHRV